MCIHKNKLGKFLELLCPIFHVSRKIYMCNIPQQNEMKGKRKDVDIHKFIQADITIKNSVKVSRFNIQNTKTNVKKKKKFSSNQNSKN